ncbi:DUF6893 family small protein [Mycolicibacterium moriokaense]
MEAIGWVATGVIAVVIIGGVVIGLRSIPDVRRYMKMRNM